MQNTYSEAPLQAQQPDQTLAICESLPSGVESRECQDPENYQTRRLQLVMLGCMFNYVCSYMYDCVCMHASNQDLGVYCIECYNNYTSRFTGVSTKDAITSNSSGWGSDSK